MKAQKNIYRTSGDYEIIVEGLVEASRFSGVEEVNVSHLPNGQTRISGHYPDQAYLFGILIRVRDMAIPLISVICSRTENYRYPTNDHLKGN